MPARIAAPPRPNSIPSCSPAVPPPPVCGAPFGYGVGDELCGATYVNVGEGDACGDELEVAVDVGLTVDVGLAVELAFAVLVGVARAVVVAELEADEEVPGENIAGWVDEGEPVHAATAVETRTVNAAVPTAGAARNFMKPPCMAGQCAPAIPGQIAGQGSLPAPVEAGLRAMA
jgi:hypothetical protein